MNISMYNPDFNLRVNWTYLWRKLHCLNAMDQWTNWERHYERDVDAGYCLDRYNLEDALWKN
jgi:hypothetical protein